MKELGKKSHAHVEYRYHIVWVVGHFWKVRLHHKHVSGDNKVVKRRRSTSLIAFTDVLGQMRLASGPCEGRHHARPLLSPFVARV